MKYMTTETVPTTDEEALEYLPDTNVGIYNDCKMLYEIRRLRGDSVLDALLCVCLAFAGEEEDQ